MPKNLKRAKKDRSLSVTTGSDIFGPTDVNTMVVDWEETLEVSITLSGESVRINVTCLVHPGPQVMSPSHYSDGVCGSYPKWSIPMPSNSVDHNVKVLRVDMGCTAGQNISHL